MIYPDLSALGAAAALMTAAWIVSVLKKDAGVADLFWGPALWVCGALAWVKAPAVGFREDLILGLAGLWALRLSAHLAWRNRGQGEDRRYAAMRREHGRAFPLRSLVSVFFLQALLAWLIAWPLQAAVLSSREWGWLDGLGLALFLWGFLFEATADWQLLRFRSQRANKGKVMDRGLWRYTRHPNYFGECLLWWGFGLFALSSGAWAALTGSVLITFLLLKVSGVTLLEKTIVERRPDYRKYIRTTPAFIPGIKNFR